jgi:O-antigen ligase
MTRRRDWRGLLLRGACAIAGLAVLVFVARAVSNANAGSDGMHLPMLAIAVVIAPAAVYLAFRYPLIFPFGLYVALVPFDAILSVTSGTTLVRLIAGLAGITLVTRMLLLRRFVKPGKGWYAWAAFVVWAGVSLMWTPDLPESQRVYGIVLQNFLMMTVLAFYPVKEIEFRWLCVLSVVSGLFAALYTFSQHSMMSGDRLTLTASGGLYLDPNYFATSFVLPIALSLSVALSSRDLRLKLLCWACAIFMMIPILMTASRGGVVAMGLLFVYFAARSPRRLQIVAIAVICLALTSLYPAVWDRFLHDPGQQGSGSGRTFIWVVGWHAIQQNWMFGTGVGSFLETYDQNFLAVYQPVMQGWHRPSHDIIVGTWVELGLIGVVLVLGAWYATFRQLRAIPKSSKYYPIRIGLEASLLALFAQSLFIDPIWIKYIWLAQSVPLLLLNVRLPAADAQPAAVLGRSPAPARILAARR